MRRSYATDLSDSEWAYLRDRLPELPKNIKTRVHSLRDIFDAIFFYVLSRPDVTGDCYLTTFRPGKRSSIISEGSA